MNNEPWVSLDDIAKHMGVSRDTIYRAIEKRGLPAHKIGRLWKFKVSEVDALVREGNAAKGTGDT
jgi:excisionase family DNA binding protein